MKNGTRVKVEEKIMIRQGPTEIVDNNLIIHFERQKIRYVDGSTELERTPWEKDTKVVKIKNNIGKTHAETASGIVKKMSKYLHESRIEEIEQLLIQLSLSEDRKNEKNDRRYQEEEKRRDNADYELEYETNGRQNNRRNVEQADMNNLDDYVELLYQVSGKDKKDREENLRKQEEATGLILSLCRNVINLEQLIQNNTVMQ